MYPYFGQIFVPAQDCCISEPHSYYLFSSGTVGAPTGTYPTRLSAETAMREFCTQHNIEVECTEDDKHYKKYSNHAGVRFYINRI